jgi:hypothetical protein
VILRRLSSVAKDVADNAATAVVELEASAAKDEGEGTPGIGKLMVKKRSEKEGRSSQGRGREVLREV